jgi:hypothetical protein
LSQDSRRTRTRLDRRRRRRQCAGAGRAIGVSGGHSYIHHGAKTHPTDLGADRGQGPQVRPGPGGGHQDFFGLVPDLGRDRPGPLGQLQRDRLGERATFRQSGQQYLVTLGQRLYGLVLASLLELIRREGVVTATEAARQLGGSTGLYSFHLRQLARYGVIEEAPGPRGRVRPWRLTEPGAARSLEQPSSHPVSDAELSLVARGLEDESYRRWLEHRDTVPGP